MPLKAAQDFFHKDGSSVITIKLRNADDLDRFVTAAGLPDHLVTGVLEHLFQVQADDRLIVGDDHPCAFCRCHQLELPTLESRSSCLAPYTAA